MHIQFVPISQTKPDITSSITLSLALSVPHATISISIEMFRDIHNCMSKSHFFSLISTY